jgi:hypothetical protein
VLPTSALSREEPDRVHLVAVHDRAEGVEVEVLEGTPEELGERISGDAEAPRRRGLITIVTPLDERPYPTGNSARIECRHGTLLNSSQPANTY